MTRVLYVENAIGFGGSLTGLLELIEHLPADIEPILVTSYDVRPFVTLPERLVAYEHIPMEPPPPHPGGALRGTWYFYRYNLRPWGQALARLVRKHQPDILHGNNASLINAAVALTGKWLGVPTVSFQKGYENNGRLERWLLKSQMFSHHICVSPSLGRGLEELGLSPARWSMIYEPISAPRFPARPAARAPVTIGMHSMLTEWKGQHVFLEAIGQLRRMTNVPFRVIVAGNSPNGDPTYPARLKNLVTTLGLESIVEFPGLVRDTGALLANIDISVHASTMPEPFGRVVAEAMIHGLAVVATRAGGPADYVSDGETGLLAAMGDATEMAGALQKLVNNPALRHNLGMKAREAAVRMFNPTHAGEKVADVYARLLPNATSRVA